MTYWNPVMRMGVDEFARRVAEAGGAGLITPDLIPDEAAEWFEASDKYGLDRVFLVAPSSSRNGWPDGQGQPRLRLCGVDHGRHRRPREGLQSAAERWFRPPTRPAPSGSAWGWASPRAEHVREIGAYAEGAIVGTALVAELGHAGVDALGALAARLSEGTARA